MIINCMIDHGAYEPTKAHEADAGFDIRTPKSFRIWGNNSAVIDTGVHFEIPNGYVGFLKSKSGLNVKCSLVGEGVIDSEYTGSVVVKLYNLGKEDKWFDVGDKIIQIVFLPIPEVTLRRVDEFSETDRGDKGFGSTGR